MTHLIAIKLDLGNPQKASLIDQLTKLNSLAEEPSGFTFCAISLERCNYELTIKLFDKRNAYICDALVHLDNYHDQKRPAFLTMWVPILHHKIIIDRLKVISTECSREFKTQLVMPNEWVRIRLVGQDSREIAQKLGKDKELHDNAVYDADFRCKSFLKFHLGRHIEEQVVNFTYFNTQPRAVDIVLKGKEGRLLWYDMIKNKSHLVGGFRDFTRLSW